MSVKKITVIKISHRSLTMALVSSHMIPLGTKAPDFTLGDPINGGHKTLTDLQGHKATVILFLCNHCPYVIHVKPELKKLAADYQTQGVSFIGINSNDATNYPDDAPDLMTHEHYPFAYLYDETQEVATSYQAACTPDIYIFDKDLRLAYRGRLDSSTPGNYKPLTGEDVRSALDALLQNTPINQTQKPSMGCSIKWRR